MPSQTYNKTSNFSSENKSIIYQQIDSDHYRCVIRKKLALNLTALPHCLAGVTSMAGTVAGGLRNDQNVGVRTTGVCEL